MIRIVLFVLMAQLAVAPAYAWGKIGHRVTGAIAVHYLSDNAKAAIESILGPEGLAEGSTWADFMRASPEDFWQMESSAYHYVTIPAGMTYAQAGAPPQGDAITAITKFTRTLKDPDASREDKALALRFIVHIIGDLHQPLHAGNGTDRGGNDFEVTYFGRETNLHAVWDSGMIDGEQLSYSEMTEWLVQKITPEEAADWMDINPVVWAAESAAIRDTIYPADPELRYGYVFNHIDTVKLRLSQAGVRIAAYLNVVLAQSS
ncbi:S1/P1 nuclease [Hyphococcus flavus]|uniref:S1/P1 nuclease n=1 Tax=Hyphococcus flavus TaxID=1866326 RepID=A0AAE9Z9T3_9PROT|nr:S1/P1 nuclease [Hyphococcus flavus]WDI30039.1 S1/P1 nuclease [Hyphococcus flavus]